MTWNKMNSRERIKQSLDLMKNIDITALTSTTQLDNIGRTQAFEVHAAHAYVEILGAPGLLDSDSTESLRSHRRYLRYLHIYQLAVHEIFQQVDATGDLHARRVDFQNQRLHFLVTEPFDDEVKRVAQAVAIGAVLQRLVQRCNELHPELGDARIRVGIDSGPALAVSNGTKGDREPLFLGNPANQAAKLLAGGGAGIYLSSRARQVLNPAWLVDRPEQTPLTQAQILACENHVGLKFDLEALAKRWEEALLAMSQNTFQFSRPIPPLKDLSLDDLTPKNSRRLDSGVIYADIDGFTRFVAMRIARASGRSEAVKALHVIRKEVRDVLKDFGGRKLRYNGDCQVGVLAEGDDVTDPQRTMSRAVLCAAAMRSSFELIQEELPCTKELGLAIGLDGGPVSITRIGPRGSRFRCIVGRAVNEAERVQQACNGGQTALATGGHAWALKVVQELLPENRPTSGVTYNRVHAALEVGKDPTIQSPAVAAGIVSSTPIPFLDDE